MQWHAAVPTVPVIVCLIVDLANGKGLGDDIIIRRGETLSLYETINEYTIRATMMYTMMPYCVRKMNTAL